MYEGAPPLRHDWKSFTYTDGSFREDTHMVGAGVYDPQTELKVRLNLEDLSSPSINTAELAAIHYAIQHGATCIATDSKVSIHQIVKQMHYPQAHKFHPLRGQLQRITECIAASPCPIRLVKVKSHVGIVGNEIADELAVAAQADTQLQEDETTAEYQSGDDGRRSLYWPAHVTKKVVTARNGTTSERTVRKAVKNTISHVQRISKETCKLGMAKLDTQYYTFWNQSEDMRDPCSYHMMHSGKISQAERSTALKYRTGTMYSAKMRYRMRKADSDRCLLCGEEDGGHHTAAGCSKLLKLYTYRHNMAGKAMARAVLQGGRGAELIVMDMGSLNEEAAPEEHMTTHLMQEVAAKRIPETVLPRNMPQSAKSACMHGSRPDMLLFKPRTRTDPAKYTVVEIKYCRDTDTAGQGERATSQHATLVDAIKQADPTAQVEYLAILLGVSGSIYTDWTLQPLQTLGVSGRHLRKLKYKLHCIAVQQLRWIYCHKQNQERALAGNPCGTKLPGSKKRRRNEGNQRSSTTRSCKRHKS
jgi:ribonuclease HI